MITDYGMSGRFKNMALTQRGMGMTGVPIQDNMFHREYSEATQQYIDEEIAHMVERRYELVKETLGKNLELVNRIAGLLLEKETLDEKEFKALVAQATGA
jgi:cell division protease FtsH